MYLLRMSIVCIVLLVLTMIQQIHIIQLNSYNLDQQILWYKKNVASFIINIVLFISLILVYEFKLIFIYFVSVICLFGVLIQYLPRKQKKKLVYTARIKRLIFICLVLFFIAFLPAIFSKKDADIKYALYAVALAPFIIFIAYLISLPIENAIRKKYANIAKNIIDSYDDLYTIGITGSFGKTSVKYFLDTILSVRYSVCKTPESFNTAMGATLTIRNDLKHIDDFFICEMGARRVHDIKEICDIVSPSGGILTDVGYMHLDTFKNIENVKKCKFELVDAVYSSKPHKKYGKLMLANGDNELIREHALDYKFNDGEFYTYGFNDINDFYIKSYNVTDDGTTFSISIKDSVKKKININLDGISFTTKLIGRYNILNLLASISYALLLKYNTNDIKEGLKNIVAVPHRLELLKTDNDCLIIDDAYNSNPKGARNAVDAITNFHDYTKIIITPGMVEFGDRQAKENEEFASYCKDKVDYALVVGKTNKEALEKGFKSGNLREDQIIYFSKVEEAIFYARNDIKGKRVILLENDLSDNY